MKIAEEDDKSKAKRVADPMNYLFRMATRECFLYLLVVVARNLTVAAI
jgi:hypothetical protein